MMPASSLTRERYFAAADDDELGMKLWSRFELASREHTPRAARWNAAFKHYVGDETEAGRTWGMTRRGDVGELAAIRINRARRGSKARQALIASGDVRWKARCRRTDTDGQLATLVAETWLEQDFEAGGIKSLWKYWGELSEVFGDAYAFTEWDWTRGSDVPRPGGAGVQRDGDLRTTILPPWLVASDSSVMSDKDRNWWFLTMSRPKPDLAHLYRKVRRGKHFSDGDEAERLIWDARSHVADNRYGWGGQSGVDSSEHDNADVVTFVHMPTLSLPLGLFVRMLHGDLILECRPLIGAHGDYDTLIAENRTLCPVQRLSADEIPGTPHAWAPFFNVIATQELLDGIDTVAATTVTSMGHPVYAIEKNSDNSPTKLASGPEVWKLGPGGKKPELIERPQISDSLLKFREMLGQEMQEDFALNDEATGQSQSKEKNAQAEALRASMAIQQVGPQAEAWRKALMDLGMIRLMTLRKNIRGERLLRMVGEKRRHAIEATRFFTGKTLEPLDSVEIEAAPPQQATAEGRQALMEFYKSAGLIKSAEDVESIMSTGRIEMGTDPVRDENILVETENEQLQRGEQPHLYPTQNHVLHMRQHASVTFSQQALGNPALLQAFDAHERQHWLMRFGCARDADPLYRPRYEFIMGRGPEPQAPIPPPIAAQQAPAAGQPQPAAPPPPTGAPPAKPPAPPTAAQPSTVASTKHPTNPLTKQPFSPTQAPVQGVA